MAAAENVLAEFRAEIDAIDADMVMLLARRMAVVERVIAAKRANGLPALIPARVEEVAAHVRRRAAEAGAPPDFAEAVWRTMMDWVIAYEDERLAPAGAFSDRPEVAPEKESQSFSRSGEIGKSSSPGDGVER
ncbi:MAG: chorismate mutase [Pseudochelatococcus sp.]|jgi:isochorismate pyruvate lyase|uniref:chorismate mutase n=1 Tax=Pseudochelatococcus sp. TaxID=2020869 RepID=UPI003D929D2B